LRANVREFTENGVAILKELKRYYAVFEFCFIENLLLLGPGNRNGGRRRTSLYVLVASFADNVKV
jgi:hypothetical protein